MSPSSTPENYWNCIFLQHIYFPALRPEEEGGQRVLSFSHTLAFQSSSWQLGENQTPLFFFCFSLPSLLSPPSISFEARRRKGFVLLAASLPTKQMDAHLYHFEVACNYHQSASTGSLWPAYSLCWAVFTAVPLSRKQVCQRWKESLACSSLIYRHLPMARPGWWCQEQCKQFVHVSSGKSVYSGNFGCTFLTVQWVQGKDWDCHEEDSTEMNELLTQC